jgi:hypothetical protein
MIDILSGGMLGAVIRIEGCKIEDRRMASLITGRGESGWVVVVLVAGR